MAYINRVAIRADITPLLVFCMVYSSSGVLMLEGIDRGIISKMTPNHEYFFVELPVTKNLFSKE
jgi:hypothetical protein